MIEQILSVQINYPRCSSPNPRRPLRVAISYAGRHPFRGIEMPVIDTPSIESPIGAKIYLITDGTCSSGMRKPVQSATLYTTGI